jgi:hypothetical protein
VPLPLDSGPETNELMSGAAIPSLEEGGRLWLRRRCGADAAWSDLLWAFGDWIMAQVRGLFRHAVAAPPSSGSRVSLGLVRLGPCRYEEVRALV